MNLFYLHPDPTVAAQMQCDKHVVKMLLETAQMLCTAHHEVDGSRASKRLYKSAYKNHPSTRWVRADAYHYEWAYKHFAALCDEYTYRYGKVHTTDRKLRKLLSKPPRKLAFKSWQSDPPQCMPDDYKQADTVKAYRAYYQSDDKRRFAAWRKLRPAPNWWK